MHQYFQLLTKSGVPLDSSLPRRRLTPAWPVGGLRGRWLVAIVMLVCCVGTPARADYILTTLATFTGANGAGPSGGLRIDNGGNLYGTTSSGGAHGNGTVFELSTGSSSVTTLASFDGANGSRPLNAGLLANGGNLYGTANTGGNSGVGTIFQLTGGTLSPLISFNHDNGANPYGNLVADSNGNLYGTTAYDGTGGSNPHGTIFEVAAGTSILTTLASFDYPDSTIGGSPLAGLVIDNSGNLYGTTTYGGANNAGTIFKVAAGSHTVSVLAALDYSTFNAGLLVDSSGNLYGTTGTGGTYGDGSIFELTAGSSTVTTLASFNSNNGPVYPVGSLIMNNNGDLYGTTSGGGANGSGSAFELAAGSGTVTTLASFTGDNGYNPYGGLVADGNGNFYGTANSGPGEDGSGTIFELSPMTPVAVPEPTSTVLWLVGGVVIGWYGWRGKRSTIGA